MVYSWLHSTTAAYLQPFLNHIKENSYLKMIVRPSAEMNMPVSNSSSGGYHLAREACMMDRVHIPHWLWGKGC